METVIGFILGGSKIAADSDYSHEIKSLQIVTTAMKLKDACSLEEKLWPT